MPKNSSMRIRTSASLIPTSSFQIARTNFIGAASNDWRALLADERAGGPNLFDRAAYSYAPRTRWMPRRTFRPAHGAGRLARGAARDAGARLAADPRQPHPAGDPGDRRAADGPSRRDPARRGDARAQPHLHLQPAAARPPHRLLADDGDRARPALQCGARRPPDLPRRPVAACRRACRLTGCCCGTSAT